MISRQVQLTSVVLIAITACTVQVQGGEEDSTKQRRARLQNMTDAEKQALLEKKRLFYELPREEQEQLKKLHEQLVQDPECDRLRITLERYNQWLRTLRPGERAQLISLPPKERLARIREIMRSQETQRFRALVGGSLSKDDKQVIQRWLDEFISSHEEEFLASIPDEHFQKKLMELDAERRKIVLSGFIWRPGNELPRPTTEDRSRLSESLSREARDLLTKASDDEERDRILDTWIRAATFSRMWRQPSSEELEKFAKKLTPEQREHLESLPRERMFEELRKMYYRDRFPDRGRGSGFRRPGRGPGGGTPGGPGQPGGPGGDHRRRGGKFPD